METPLAKDGTLFSGGNGFCFGSGWVMCDFNKGGKFHVPKRDWFREDGTALISFASSMEAWKVFRDGQSVRAGSKVSHSDTVGNKALMCCDPGAEFPEWLLEMILEIRVEDITVLTEDLIAEEV